MPNNMLITGSLFLILFSITTVASETGSPGTGFMYVAADSVYFDQLDKNKDGLIDREEANDMHHQDNDFTIADKNKDQKLNKEEFGVYTKKQIKENGPPGEPDNHRRLLQ